MMASAALPQLQLQLPAAAWQTSADHSRCVGGMDPKFSHDKPDRETLLRLLKTCNEYVLRMDGFRHLTVMDKWGNDEAFD
jgi:hypothetical protein